MLSALIVENFKAFGQRQVIPLAPITLIFGANSAGKSSILQALLLLKQTVAEAENNEVVLLPKGAYTDLGSFRELAYRHDVSLTCEITPILDSKEVRSVWNRLRVTKLLSEGSIDREHTMGIGVRTRYDASRRSIDLVSLPAYWGDTESPIFTMRGSRSSESPSETVRRVRVTDVDPHKPVLELLFAGFRQQRLGEMQKELDRQFAMMDQMITYARAAISNPQLAPSSKQAEGIRPRASQDLLRTWYRHYVLSTASESLSEKDILTDLEQLMPLLTEQIERLKSYDLASFIEDTEGLSAKLKVPVRNFLLDEFVGRALADDKQVGSISREMSYLRNSRPQVGTPNLASVGIGLSWALRKVLNRTVYVGPLREHPERHYIYGGNLVRDVGKSGRLLPDLLYGQKSLVERTNNYLDIFDTGYQLQVDQVTDTDVFSLRLVDKRSGTLVSMLDVGFGISQVLPVIVQSVLSRNQLVLIEQPEIHLHPRLQAELGQLFKDCVSEGSSNQLIVETHSEHLILRLQRLIRKGELKPADVSVIYVLRDEEGSHCLPLRLDAQGDFIDAWPGGFFEEDFAEVFADR